jgi:hypothetical protein
LKYINKFKGFWSWDLLGRASVRLAPLVIVAALAGLGGCAKENCEKLLTIACDHVADKDDGVFQCQKLREQSESFTDEQCAESLLLLKESGKLQNLR